MEHKPLKHVTGMGGIFFKAREPGTLKQWYWRHLGIASDECGATFQWRDENEPEKLGYTVWSPFPSDTKYFDPSSAPFMINYRLADSPVYSQHCAQKALLSRTV